MSNRLSVGYVVSMPHGLDRWTFREIDAFENHGIEVVIFPIRYHDGPYMPKPTWRCCPVSGPRLLWQQVRQSAKSPKGYLSLLREAIQTKTVRDYLIAVDFASQMTQQQVQMIHAVFGDHKLFVAYYCKKMLGIPLSVALYGHDLRDNPNWPMFQRAIRLCDEIVVNCDFNKQLLAEVAGEAIAEKAKVIRHFAEIYEEDDSSKVKVLMVGGFHERKGHDVLFNAIRRLVSDGQRIEVWVVGYKGYIDVEQLARTMGVNEQVRVLGSLPDALVEILFQECDIFVLPSKTDRSGVNEGLPVALIEAMAHGKPVITTRMAGIPELVEAVLIEEGDVETLVKALRRYIDDPELRLAHGARNLEIVKERYSEKNAAQMRDVFLSALQTEHAGSAEGVPLDQNQDDLQSFISF